MNERSGTPERPPLRAAMESHQARILEGIARAYAEHDELDQGTARLIADALGRALSKDSKLSAFGRTGEGMYEELREEYLALYNEPNTPPMIKEWIDWLGTYIVANNSDGSGRQFMSEHAAPQLDRILVRTDLTVAGEIYRMYAPATLVAADYRALATRLETLGLAAHDDLQAFLSLRDVNAADENLADAFAQLYVGVFSSIEDALRNTTELPDWESELQAFARDRGIPGVVTIDPSAIEAVAREMFEYVPLKDKVYVFLR